MSISCVWRAFSLFLRHQTINTRDKFQAAKGWINFTHTCWKKWVAIARSDTSWQTLSHCRKSAPHQIRHIRSVCRHPHPAQQIPRPLLESFSPRPVVTRLLEPAPLLLSDHELQQLSQKAQSYLLQEEPQTCQHSSFKAFPFSSFSTLTSSCGQPHDTGFNFSSASLESFFFNHSIGLCFPLRQDCFILTNKEEYREKSPNPSTFSPAGHPVYIHRTYNWQELLGRQTNTTQPLQVTGALPTPPGQQDKWQSFVAPPEISTFLAAKQSLISHPLFHCDPSRASWAQDFEITWSAPTFFQLTSPHSSGNAVFPKLIKLLDTSNTVTTFLPWWNANRGSCIIKCNCLLTWDCTLSLCLFDSDTVWEAWGSTIGSKLSSSCHKSMGHKLESYKYLSCNTILILPQNYVEIMTCITNITLLWWSLGMAGYILKMVYHIMIKTITCIWFLRWKSNHRTSSL